MTAPIVVYSLNDGSIRRIILPDTVAQGQMFITALAPGEAATSTAGPTDLASCQAVVQAVRGTPCASGRCVVVASGNVVGISLGDPKIDTNPQGQLVSSDVADLGDKWDGAIFTRLTAVVDTTTNRITRVDYQPLGMTAAPNTRLIKGRAAQGLKVGDAVQAPDPAPVAV
jgi:hypothetical protein